MMQPFLSSGSFGGMHYSFDDFGLLMIFIGIFIAALWLWSLVDVLKRPYHDATEKLIWVFVIISTFFLLKNGPR